MDPKIEIVPTSVSDSEVAREVVALSLPQLTTTDLQNESLSPSFVSFPPSKGGCLLPHLLSTPLSYTRVPAGSASRLHGHAKGLGEPEHL